MPRKLDVIVDARNTDVVAMCRALGGGIGCSIHVNRALVLKPGGRHRPIALTSTCTISSAALISDSVPASLLPVTPPTLIIVVLLGVPPAAVCTLAAHPDPMFPLTFPADVIVAAGPEMIMISMVVAASRSVTRREDPSE